MRTMFGLAAVASDGSLEGHHTATACNVSSGCENETRKTSGAAVAFRFPF